MDYRLKFAQKEKQKREKMIEQRKIKSMVAKYCKNRKEISLLNKKKEDYKSDNRNNIDLNQANN